MHTHNKCMYLFINPSLQYQNVCSQGPYQSAQRGHVLHIFQGSAQNCLSGGFPSAKLLAIKYVCCSILMFLDL